LSEHQVVEIVRMLLQLVASNRVELFRCSADNVIDADRPVCRLLLSVWNLWTTKCRCVG